MVYLKYSDRQAWANSPDPDQMQQGLLCLLLIQLYPNNAKY